MITREKRHPRPYEVLDEMLNRGDAKELARRFSCSPSTVRAWCREPDTEEYTNGTGRFSFLDYGREIISMIKEDDGCPDRAYPIADYFAHHLGGTFVPHKSLTGKPNQDLMTHVASILKEHGEVIAELRKAYYEESPGVITQQELAKCLKESKEAIVSLVQLNQWLEEVAR